MNKYVVAIDYTSSSEKPFSYHWLNAANDIHAIAELQEHIEEFPDAYCFKVLKKTRGNHKYNPIAIVYRNYMIESVSEKTWEIAEYKINDTLN